MDATPSNGWLGRRSLQKVDVLRSMRLQRSQLLLIETIRREPHCVTVKVAGRSGAVCSRRWVCSRQQTCWSLRILMADLGIDESSSRHSAVRHCPISGCPWSTLQSGRFLLAHSCLICLLIKPIGQARPASHVGHPFLA